MVATRLNEVANKGIDWAYGGPSSSPESKISPPPPSAAAEESPNNNNNSYWSYATSSLQSAYDTTNATLAGLLSNVLYTTSTKTTDDLTKAAEESIQQQQQDPSDSSGRRRRRSFLSSFSLMSNSRQQQSSSQQQQQQYTTYPSWLLFENPYSSVRGRQHGHHPPQSLDAVRSLLTLLPEVAEDDEVTPKRAASSKFRHESSLEDDSMYNNTANNTILPLPHTTRVSKSETASQLAEGTLRALRDVTLTEAVELHEALRYWTIRWERPLLSWLEAGPWVWCSKDGYDHKIVGQKVSQIQAVLARRCASIGELQQHLLRAGWQQGVAQWGVLGQGGQWAAVSGFDGAMADNARNDDNDENREIGRRRLSTYALEHMNTGWSPIAGSSTRLPEDPNAPLYYGHASVFVRNTDGGTIQTDNPALVAWSVDAMRLIRDQLYRAGNGRIELPREANWSGNEAGGGGDELGTSPEIGANPHKLPAWVSMVQKPPPEGDDRGEKLEIHAGGDSEQQSRLKDDSSPDPEDQPVSFDASDESIEDARPPTVKISPPIEAAKEGSIVITNLPMMATEVSELLNSMEVIMQVQRRRRLDKLKPLSKWRRGWYKIAVGSPIVLYVSYKLLRNGLGLRLATLAVDRVLSFYREHISGPLFAIFDELLARRNRDTISDRRARADAIETLKKMIRSWLDETYPKMNEAERAARAESMDMSLIEQKKEADMKTIYEINSVIRMSFIEMQFIKKEMMNALYAMDEILSSNEINISIAAVTPAVVLIYTARHVFRFLYYALLRLGKSREETFASFRHVILDIERLLVMRDHPPSVPPPLHWEPAETAAAIIPEESLVPSVLTSDDLGMLMLHVHECRSILWNDRRRFSPQNLRDLSEDLSELSGERGAVSVQQQLQIISRMCRTYPFLKVVSTGVSFDLSRAASRAV